MVHFEITPQKSPFRTFSWTTRCQPSVGTLEKHSPHQARKPLPTIPGKLKLANATENGSGLVVTVLRSDRPSLGIEAEYMAVINTNSEPLMNVETAAQYLCVHPKTLMKMAREHRVPAFRVGRYWLFRASLIDAWLQEQLEYGQANRAA